jgi:hypothetical protein
MGPENWVSAQKSTVNGERIPILRQNIASEDLWREDRRGCEDIHTSPVPLEMRTMRQSG